MTKLTLSRGLNEGLRKALENDPKVLIMGEDVGKLGGVFRVTDALQKDFGEARVIDTPLAPRSAWPCAVTGRSARSSSTGSSSRRSTRSSASWPRCATGPSGRSACRW